MQPIAYITRKPRSVEDYHIVAVAEVPSNMARWDRVLFEIETHITAAIVHVLRETDPLDWSYLNTLKARHCTFSAGLVVHTDALQTVNYRYVVLRGSIPFNISFEEAQNANDRPTNLSRVAPCC